MQRLKLRFFSATSTAVPIKFADLCSKGSLKEAFENFRSEICSDPSLFSHLLQGCVKSQSLSLLKQLHSLITTCGCSRNRFVTNHLISAYAKFGELGTAAKLFDVMPRKNITTRNILIGGFMKKGDIESAKMLFDQMPERNVATWNAMVAGMIQFELNEDGLRLFWEMRNLGFMPDDFTLGSVLRGCAGLKDLSSGRQIHGYVVKSGWEFSTFVGSSLAHMYAKSRGFEDGERVMKALPVLNVATCNALISGKAQNGYPEEALDQYNKMKAAGFRPTEITLMSVLSSCSELETLALGEQLHAEAIKSGAVAATGVTSSLISVYSRCGCLDEATKVFSEREEDDVVVWSSMITAYGFHRKAHEAIKLFHQMEKKNLEPSEVTFLILLSVCSHYGLKDEGMEFFDLMVKKYRMQPQLRHYTCVVDMLGQSGCLEEAEALIRAMPVKADAFIWKTLLSACKIHKNWDMVKRVAEEDLGLDPNDSASYLLLSNSQASAKRRKFVSEVRTATRGDRMVKKEPCVSWLEFKNQVHHFWMGDVSHPQAMQIGACLKELTRQMELGGYVPDSASILHDMDAEEKEHNLAFHSKSVGFLL